MSLPGLVDPSTGTALYIPYFLWRDLPISKMISDAVGLPVVIDNDANAVALAELWFGRPEVNDATRLHTRAGCGRRRHRNHF